MNERAVSGLDLAVALARGLALAVVGWPLVAWAGATLATRLPDWPLASWLPYQLGGGTLALCVLLCVLREGRGRARARLREPDRDLLVALATVGGLLLALGVGELVRAEAPVRLLLALAGAITAGGAAGALLWRGSPFYGACLGWTASTLGLVGALVAALAANALGQLCQPALGGLSPAASTSLALAGSLSSWYWTASAISSTDPLIGHSWLERAGKPG